MKFQPKSEREIAEANLLKPGTYDFEVAEAEERVSKAGNDMIVLKLFVFGEDGGRRVVTDWLMESVPHKLRHAADAMGLLQNYDSGELVAEDFWGKTGKVKIGIRKDATGQYPDQNRVLDYVKENGAAAASTPRKAAPIDDEIPF